MTLLIFHLDDEIQILERYAKVFSKSILGIETKIQSFSKVSDLDRELNSNPAVSIFIIDIYLDNAHHSGITVVERCRQLYPNALIFVSSTARDPEIIHSSLVSGADDFISKDLSPSDVVDIIENKLAARRSTKTPVDYLNQACGATMASIGLRIPNLIASAVNCVHVLGETGTGKEVVANLIESSLPKGTPFIRINCGAIPPALIVSELFGHSKGSFTGATSEKPGLLEAASGGWVFLDEVATLPMDAQITLLRAIDDQKIRRIGSTKDIHVNFRVISATNESIEDLVKSGKFRKDLWQRLREAEINLPPLRLRKGEIPELASYFCRHMRGGPYVLAPTILPILTQYDWQDGNIRELRNCLRAMTEKASNRILTHNCLPEYIWPHILNTTYSLEEGRLVDSLKSGTSILLTWPGEERPDFETLTAILLFQLIKIQFKKTGKTSMRALAKHCGIPKSSMSTKVQNLITLGLSSEAELKNMVNFKADMND